jgi:hypothetical protein
MANPTTNYGFVLPTATDLVTDLPADFDVALQGVDTRLKALQPGTTLGDIAYSSATANTNTRLGIGTAGQVLTVASGVPSWATASSGGGLTLLSTTSLSGSSTTVSSISGSYKNLILVMKNLVGGDSGQVYLRLNGITTSNYAYGAVRNIASAVSAVSSMSDSKWQVIDRLTSSAAVLASANGVVTIYRYTDTDFVFADWQTNGSNNVGADYTNSAGTGKFDNTAAITSVTLFPDTGTFTGTLYIYGES